MFKLIKKNISILYLLVFITSLLANNSYSSSLSEETKVNSENVVKVATFDSGFGGFFTAKEIEKRASSLSKNGYGPFEIAHYGDTLNLPYGEKTPEQIANFTAGGVMTAFNDGFSDVYIACNTASTQYNRVKEIIRKTNPEYAEHIYSIIDISGDEVMKTVNDRLKTQDDVTIAIIATPATIKSENYPRYIFNSLHVDFKPSDFTKITQPRWLKSKGDSIDSYTSTVEVTLSNNKKVKIYQLAPANWVDMIENGASDEEKETAVKNDIKKLTEQFNKDSKFDVVGEFCTHYPVFDSMIKKEMKSLNKVNDAPFIVQGPLMGDLFEKKFLENNKIKSLTSVRDVGDLKINLSGDNIEETKELVKKIFPEDTSSVIEKKSFVIIDE